MVDAYNRSASDLLAPFRLETGFVMSASTTDQHEGIECVPAGVECQPLLSKTGNDGAGGCRVLQVRIAVSLSHETESV
jgi:hypothetical protein